MNPVTSWGNGRAVPEYFPRQGALTIDRAPLPEMPTVRVIATAATWRVGGETVTPGATYSLPGDVAAGLIARGKARMV